MYRGVNSLLIRWIYSNVDSNFAANPSSNLVSNLVSNSGYIGSSAAATSLNSATNTL